MAKLTMGATTILVLFELMRELQKRDSKVNRDDWCEQRGDFAVEQEEVLFENAKPGKFSDLYDIRVHTAYTAVFVGEQFGLLDVNPFVGEFEDGTPRCDFSVSLKFEGVMALAVGTMEEDAKKVLV